MRCLFTLEGWHQELKQEADAVKRVEIARRIEAYCDEGNGSCVLRDPRAARLVQEVLFEYHGVCCELHSWVVMPNHVHVLLTPLGLVLEKVVHRIKGASALQVNRLLGQKGRLWQPGYFDRLIRNSNHFDGTKRYIELNPVKAKLCTDPALWAWSSCNADARARLDFLLGEREKKKQP